MVKEDAEDKQPTNAAEHHQQQNQPENMPNPYGLRGSIEPEQFIVPEALVKQITESLVKKQSISLIGPRMIGKSSLLNFLASPLCQVYYQNASASFLALRFATLDLQEHSDKNRDELMLELAFTISRSASSHFSGTTYKEALDLIKSITGRRHIGSPLWILLFDEFDQVAELSGINKTFFNDLRSLSEHHNLCYVVSSRRKLRNLPLSQDIKSSSFFNMFHPNYLKVWDTTTAEKLMFKPQGKEMAVFNLADFASITRLTARHPQLLQIACNYLFNIRRASEKEPGKFDQIFDDYMRESEDVYNTYWDDEIDSAEQTWIIEACQALSLPQTNDEAQENLRKLSLGPLYHEIRARLVELGFVVSESGDIEIPIGLKLFLRKFKKIPYIQLN
jgi:Novel STAND NTPase 2